MKLKYKCQLCYCEFETSSGLVNHIKYTHKITKKDYYDKFLKKPDEGKCLICQAETSLGSIATGYKNYCSRNCSSKGPNNPFRSEEFKKNKKKHDQDKFGCDFSTQNEEVKKKILAGKYQHSVNLLNTKLQEHNSHITCIEHSKSGIYKLHCSVCNQDMELGHSFIYNRISREQNVCINCCPSEILMSSSIMEKEMCSEIRKIYKNTIKTNDRTIIKPKEIDVYLPDIKLAFEFDGKYYHADPNFFKPDDYIKQKGKYAKEIWEYDANKIKLCEEQGVKLIRIKEYDWTTNKQKELDKIKEAIVGKLKLANI